MSDKAPKEINLDIQKCHFDKNGVTDFWWPFRQKELQSFANDAMRLYAKEISKYSDDPIVFHPYRLYAKNFVSEVVGLFQADALFARAKRENISIKIPEGTRFWLAVQNGKTPDTNDILYSLKRGPKKTSLIRKIFNLKRLTKILAGLKRKEGGIGLSLNNLKIGPLTSDILRTKIIATERYSLIDYHAKFSDIDVYFQRSDRWFSAITDEEIKNGIKNNNTDFENGILDAIEILYKKNDETLPAQSKQYFSDVLSKSAAIMRVHLNRLLEKPDTLPQRLWTGTGGQIWDATLRLAVSMNGGETCGHDHATGAGHCIRIPTYFTELWGCDYFCTFNKARADSLEKNQEGMPLLEKKFPRIIFPDTEKNIKKIKTINTPRNDKKTIILMSPPYDRDLGRPSPIMPDIVRLDWQCRLIKFLKDDGYDVILKAHPESLLQPPANLSDITGAKVSCLPLEKMMEEGNMVIFDHIFTSTFRYVLETNIPVTIIETVNFSLKEDAKSYLQERGGFITADSDTNNRLTFDEKLLSEEIKNAFAKNNNHDFAEIYLAD